ncbi:MAG: hypothetical protein AAGF15_09960, partial [Pseudomonadota bacterium]
YAPDMPAPDSDPTGLELWFDSSGYHAFPDANQDLTVYGGLGWRFQEITPNDMAQIGRTSLFRAERGIHLDPNLTFLEPDYRAVSCQWHHNPTGALMTLRRARRVLAHPDDIKTVEISLARFAHREVIALFSAHFNIANPGTDQPIFVAQVLWPEMDKRMPA